MIRMIMCGCGGKMGRVITGIVKEDAEIEIVAGIDPACADVQKNNPVPESAEGIRNDGNAAAGSGYPVFASLADCTIPADVIVDFSTPKALPSILEYAKRNRVAAVLCTTGYGAEESDQIAEAAKECAILRSANMSLGVNTIMKLVQEAAKVLATADFDMEIVEKHHNQKVDAPSGTALALADAIRSALEEDYTYTYDRSAERKKRDKHEIGISAVRGGTIVGEHEVIFAGTDEVIEIKHTAYSKAIFGKGAVSAAKFLAGRAAGMYSMKDVIG